MAYLKPNYSLGNFIETSQTPKEGFVENNWTFGNKTGTNYRKEYREPITGELYNVSIRDVDKRKEVTLTIKGDTFYNIQLPLLDSNKNIDDFVKSLILVLPNLVKGQQYSVTMYAGFTPKGKNRKYNGLTIKSDGKKVEKAYTFTTEETVGDIPAVNWTKTMETWVADARAQNEFLYNELQKQIKRFQEPTTETQPSNQQKIENKSKDPLPF